MIIQGKVHSVESYPAGTRVVNDYAIAATVLAIADSISFQSAGTVTIGTGEYAYTLSDTGDTITIDPPLEVAIEDGDEVYITPRAVEKHALVYADDGQDAILAVVPHSLQSNLIEGIREDNQRESVTVEEVRGHWEIKNIVALESTEEADAGVGKFNTLSIDGYDADADEVNDKGLLIYGTEFLDWLDTLPRGVVAWEVFGTGKGPFTAETGYGEIGFQAQPGRLYKFSFRLNAENTTSGAAVDCAARFTQASDPTAASSPTVTSKVLMRSQGQAGAYAGQDIAHSDWAMFSTNQTTPQNVRILLTIIPAGGIGSVNAIAYGDGTAELEGSAADVALTGLSLVVEDVGPVKNQGGAYNTGGAAVTPIQTYTKTWVSTDAACYMGNGSQDSSQGSEDMKQGYSSYDGDSKSLWVFPSMTGTLAGSTITKIRVYLYANFWYYNGGGTARLKVHGYTSTPGSSPSMTTVLNSTSWPRESGRWITLPTSFHAGFLSGSYRGIGVGPAGTTSQTYYGRFNKSGAKIEITYKK